MKKRTRRKLKRILRLSALGLTALLAVLAVVLLVRLLACRPHPAEEVSTPTAAPTETPVPTETAAPTQAPVETPAPLIQAEWYEQRTKMLEDNVRAYGGLDSEDAVRLRVAGMMIDPDQKMVAFTFDDGPRVGITDAILDVCAEYNVRVTFFIKGAYINGNESILKRMLGLGCEIGNHTWDHVDIETLSTDEMRDQIGSLNDTIQSLLGYPIRLFRPPYIRYGYKGSETRNALLALCDQYQMAVINHTRSTHDTYDDYTEDMVLERMVAETLEGHGLHQSIILCHDKFEKTAGAFRRAVPILLEQGYQLVTVSELLYCSDDGFHVGWIYSKAD